MISPLQKRDQKAEATRLGPPHEGSPENMKRWTGGSFLYLALALALALLPLALGLAACGDGDVGLPTSEEFVERLVAANAEPRDLHNTSVVTLTMNMGFPYAKTPGDSTPVTMIARTESWANADGRTRSEYTMRVEGFDAEEFAAFGGQDAQTIVVNDLQSLYQYQESLNIWWRRDIAEISGPLASSGMPFDPTRMDELYRDFFERITRLYDVSVGRPRTVGGRRTIDFTATPRAGMPDTERNLFGVLRLDQVDMTVDLMTWQPLASDINATIDMAAMADQMYRGGGMDEMEEVENAFVDTMADTMASSPPITFRIRTTTTSIDYEPVLSEDLFTFTPPEGAIEMGLNDVMPGADMDEESLEQMMEQMESNPAFQNPFGTATATSP